MSPLLHILPLHLAQADGDVVKVVIGVVFALIWVAAQAIAAAGARKKRQEQRQRSQAPDPPGQPVAMPPEVSAERARLERHLRQQREEAQRRREHRDAQRQRARMPAMRAEEPAAIRELRQVMGGVATRAKVAAQKPKPKRAAPQVVRERQPPASPADIGPPIGAGAGVRAGEIGSGGEEQAIAEAARRRSIAGVRSLLTPRNARNVILAAEVLRPPVALRDPGGAG